MTSNTTRISPLSLHTGLLLLLFVCIAECMFLKDSDNSRHKRGFRMNTGSRLAHGYGKRDYSDSLYSQQQQSPSQQDLSDARRKLLESLGGEETASPILSTQEFSRLLQENQELAEIIVRKFVDINDDNVISSDELFRRIRE